MWITENISYWYFTLLYRFLWTFWNYIYVDRTMPKPVYSGDNTYYSFVFISGCASRANVLFDLYNSKYQCLFSIFKYIMPSRSCRWSSPTQHTTYKPIIEVYERISSTVLHFYVKHSKTWFPQHFTDVTLIRIFRFVVGCSALKSKR